MPSRFLTNVLLSLCCLSFFMGPEAVAQNEPATSAARTGYPAQWPAGPPATSVPAMGASRGNPFRPLGWRADRDGQGVPFRLAGHESAPARLCFHNHQLVSNRARSGSFATAISI